MSNSRTDFRLLSDWAHLVMQGRRNTSDTCGQARKYETTKLNQDLQLDPAQLQSFGGGGGGVSRLIYYSLVIPLR